MDRKLERELANIRSATQLEHLASVEGARYGPRLLARPKSAWDRLMRTSAHYRSYGTLRYLLEAARKEFYSAPTVAYEITAAVLRFVDKAKGPTRVQTIALRALARKEHANALVMIGDLKRALTQVNRAIAIYGRSGALHCDAAKAKLCAAMILRDMGEVDKALALTRECAAVFLDYAESAYLIMAKMTEGAVLFARKQHAQALSIFSDLVRQMELTGDEIGLARALHNAAECARELGDLAAARDFYPRALEIFRTHGISTEAARVRWGYALALAADGTVRGTRAAISELFLVRGEYLMLGANLDAATAALDVVRIRFSIDDDVTELCTELVQTFSAAGMMQNALEALAYLREQARGGGLTQRKIARIRDYFGELHSNPTLRFVQPAN